MAILIGIIAALLLSVAVFVANSTSEAAPPAASKAAIETRALSPSQVEYRQRLQELAASEPPKKLSPGAMCYEPAMIPDRLDYTCPACNTKTVLANPKPAHTAWELDACRRALKTIKGLDIKLTETGFCAKCDPDAKQPILGIRIRYAGNKTHTVAPITASDLQLIAEFIAGKDKHDTGPGGERPLRDYTKRLAELLGTGPLKK
jgi:hypothetical protein